MSYFTGDNNSNPGLQSNTEQDQTNTPQAPVSPSLNVQADAQKLVEPIPTKFDSMVHYTADPEAEHTQTAIDTAHEQNVAVPQFADSQVKNINDSLVSFTNQHNGLPYVFGGKDVSRGGVDCSGWTGTNTLQTMDKINQQAGHEVYNMESAKTLYGQGSSAASQIVSTAHMTGFLPDKDVQSGNVPAGVLLGIQRVHVPGFAQGRPLQISHIVQVVEQSGQKYVSQTTTRGNGGVQLTPYNEFIKDPSIKRLYAVNPFSVISTSHVANQH